jgi:hypothetical protein
MTVIAAGARMVLASLRAAQVDRLYVEQLQKPKCSGVSNSHCTSKSAAAEGHYCYSV